MTHKPIPKVKITCTNIDCPERKSLCCGAISKSASEPEIMLGVPMYFCSKCGKEYQGGECDAGSSLPLIKGTDKGELPEEDSAFEKIVSRMCAKFPLDKIDWNKRVAPYLREFQLLLSREIPPAIGVSEWMNYGEKYHYDEFWKKKLMDEIVEMAEKMKIPKNNPLYGSTEEARKLTKGVWNQALDDLISKLKK